MTWHICAIEKIVQLGTILGTSPLQNGASHYKLCGSDKEHVTLRGQNDIRSSSRLELLLEAT